MHRFGMKAFVVPCVLALAGGCALRDRTGQLQPTVVPVSKVTHSAAVTDANYQIARAYHDRRQYEPAIAAYRRSLEANPGNAEARNALGVIYASQGKYEEAITELKAALALAPNAAHIHNNLGYAYLLHGRNSDALAALHAASALDPQSERIRENIKMAAQRLGPEQAPNAKGEVRPATDIDTSQPADQDRNASTSRIVNVAPNIFELRPAVPVTSSVQLSTTAVPRIVKLEVANGNGVTGLAKQTSSSLQRKGYPVYWITNQAPYTQMITEVQYRQGQEIQAKRLLALLAVPARLVESSQLRPDVGIRLVLGRDAVQRPLFAETESLEFNIAKI